MTGKYNIVDIIVQHMKKEYDELNALNAAMGPRTSRL